MPYHISKQQIGGSWLSQFKVFEKLRRSDDTAANGEHAKKRGEGFASCDQRTVKRKRREHDCRLPSNLYHISMKTVEVAEDEQDLKREKVAYAITNLLKKCLPSWDS